MDPQHRRLLTLTYKMLKSYDKNYKSLLSTLGRDSGVYTAVGTSYYMLDNLLNSGVNLDYTTYINNVPETAASKISYNFDFHGPSLNISSACSSSSLALYYAISDLTTDKIDSAIVGTSRLPVESSLVYRYKPDSIFSKTGLCSPFDKNSDGMIPGFGTIVFALKRKEDAIRDNDKILALIKGIGVSNDGSHKASYTAPGITGQCESIERAYRHSDVNIEDIDYLETHGTGTIIGDAIETETIKRCFSKKKKLEIGSIKANYGHLDVSASFLSLLKAILMLEHQEIPVQANYSSRNPLLTEESISINKDLRGAKLNNIAINSFGIGGTNAHIIIQKYDSDHLLEAIEFNSEEMTEDIYWVDSDKKEINNNSTQEVDFSEGEIISYISDYLGYTTTDVKQLSIADLDLESYVLLDLLDELHNKFSIQLEFSDFQELNSNLIDIILTKSTDTTDETSSLLHVLGNFSEQRKTLFLIHPAGGTVNGYSNFFKNNSVDYNVVLLAFPFKDVEYVRYFSLEQLARFYKDKILEFVDKVTTDFVIGGYSFGGNVAFEIARQLQIETSQAPDIIMIDSHPIEAYNHINKRQITDKAYNMALDEFMKQGVIDQTIADNNIEKYGDIWKINHDMLKNYVTPVEKLDSQLTILICKEKENDDLLTELGIDYLDKTLWQQKFNSKIHYNFIEGNHYSIYSNEVLASYVGRELSKIMKGVNNQ